MYVDARTLGSRVEFAQKWLAVNKDKLYDPNITSTLVSQFGVSEVMAGHLVNMEKMASRKR